MNTADMLVYIHPELDAKARESLIRAVESRIGVDCAEFAHHQHPHAVLVKYDPDAIRGIQILDTVRKADPRAAMVGL